MNEVVAVLVSFVLALALPSRAQCPVGWSLHEGVRRSGEFACYGPLAERCGDAREYTDPCPKPEITRSRIYCTGGSRPIVVDFRTVGCQRVR